MTIMNDAILALKPNARFQVKLSDTPNINDYDNINWMDTAAEDKPTKAAVATKLTAMISEEEHIKPRIAAYPSLQEQMDLQYKDLLNGTTTWKDAIAKVKSDNPKN